MSFDSDYTPSFQPPDWVFGPVWAFLYTSMATSIVLTWINRDELDNQNLVFALFAVQLTLNLVWTSFFNAESYLISTLILLGIVATTTYYAILVHPVSQYASILVWPYIAWVSFATLLNIAYLMEA